MPTIKPNNIRINPPLMKQKIKHTHYENNH